MNQPMSTFLLVLSIIAIVFGTVLVRYGSVWLTGNPPPPLAWLVYAVVVVVLALRGIWKRL